MFHSSSKGEVHELDNLLPFLDICGPEGQQFRAELLKDRITIGRFEQFNDVALQPDPQQLITRKVHCIVEHDASGWWVRDNGSVNRTFVQRKGIMQAVQGRALLAEGDAVRILGKLIEGGEAAYWELTFHDPLITHPAEDASPLVHLEYDWIQARLFRVDGPSQQEIHNLRPQEHKLIRYMDQRNRANSAVPVMCTYEELIAAIWGEDASRTESEINHLVWELRKKIEPDPKEPLFLETVRGLGYRLVTHTLKE